MSSDVPPRPRKATVRTFQEMKERGERITCLTAYDFLFARILEEAGIDLVLVGDSLGQVALGHDSTLPVTMDAMVHHSQAVRRGAPNTFLVADLPFMSYRTSREDALRNAGRFLQEAGAEGVKVEGGDEDACGTVEALVRSGIPVMGHLGLQPQSVHAVGGYRVQGRGRHAGDRMLAQARALEDAGCFSLVLELVPAELARRISSKLRIPTIGIGAGPHCDGQVLVLPDALGLNSGFTPRFLKRFAELDTMAKEGVGRFIQEVREGTFPGPEHSLEEED